MAITVVKKDKDEHDIPYLMFETREVEVKTYTDDGTDVMWIATVTPVDENLKPMGELISYELPDDEKSFHKMLRWKAAGHKKLEKKFCTDPEWTPDYVAPTEPES